MGNATADEIFKAKKLAKDNLSKMPFDLDAIRSTFGGMSRGEFFAWKFYMRTNIVECAIQAAIIGVKSIGDKSQEWQKASQDIRDKLAAALAEAQRWKGSRAEYITRTDVPTADVCGTGFSEQDMHLQKGW